MSNYSKSCASPVKKMADGGSVGLWERLKAGNIDQPGSEANRRWGSGSKAAAPAAPAAAPSIPDAEPRKAVGSMQGLDTTPDQSAAETARLGRKPAPAPVVRRAAGAVRAAAAKQPAQRMPSQGFGGGVSAGLNRAADVLNKPAPKKEPGSIYDQAAQERGEFFRGIGNKIKDVIGGGARDAYDRNMGATKMANGGKVGGAKSYGK